MIDNPNWYRFNVLPLWNRNFWFTQIVLILCLLLWELHTTFHQLFNWSRLYILSRGKILTPIFTKHSTFSNYIRGNDQNLSLLYFCWSSKFCHQMVPIIRLLVIPRLYFCFKTVYCAIWYTNAIKIVTPALNKFSFLPL